MIESFTHKPDVPVRQVNYSLSVEELKISPTEIIKYSNRDRINRNNLISFLINSFAISMGSADAQRAYFEWLKLHEGFDGYITIRNLFEAGGESVLNAGELDMIVNAFVRVKKHKAGKDEKEYPKYVFMRQTKMIFEGNYFMEIGNLEEMTMEELMAAFRENRNKKREKKFSLNNLF